MSNKRKRAAMQTPTPTVPQVSGSLPQSAITAAVEPGGDGVERPPALDAEMTADPVAPVELPKRVDIGAPAAPEVAAPVDVVPVAPAAPAPPAPPAPVAPMPVQAAPTPAIPPVPAPQQSVPPAPAPAPVPQAGTASGPPQAQKDSHIMALGLYDEALAALKGKSSPQEVALDLVYFLTESLTLIVGLAANSSEPTAAALLQGLGATIANANPAQLLKTVNTAMSMRLMESLAPKPKR